MNEIDSAAQSTLARYSDGIFFRGLTLTYQGKIPDQEAFLALHRSILSVTEKQTRN